MLLSDKELNDLESLDECLLEILKLDQLRIDMEAARDDLLQEYLNQQNT